MVQQSAAKKYAMRFWFALESGLIKDFCAFYIIFAFKPKLRFQIAMFKSCLTSVLRQHVLLCSQIGSVGGLLWLFEWI